MLSPMSPRKMFPSQTAYWITTGRSRPHLARSSRTVCSASPYVSSRTNASNGSGPSRESPNTRIVTPQSVMSANTSRWMMYFRIRLTVLLKRSRRA